MAKKFNINWGKKPVVRSLSIAEVKALKDRLNKEAAGNNAFALHLNRCEIEWVKKNLANGCVQTLMKFTGGKSLGRHWVAIGTGPRAIAEMKREKGISS